MRVLSLENSTMKHFYLFLSLLLFKGSFAFQNTGTLSGYIKDEKTGESIPGATVQVVELGTGAITDAQGFYTLGNLPTQTFSIKVSFVGYESQTRFNVVIRSGGNPDLNFELKETVSELGEVVVVANPFQKIEETPLSIQKLSREEIATYPGGNNDIAKVVQSLPGVSGSIGGFRNDIIIRGGAPNENVYYLDGIEIPNINHFATQGSAGGPVGLLNVSFFEGVILSTSAFAAQYDNALSGVLQFDQRNGNNRNFKTNFRLSSSESALTFEGPLFKGQNEASNTSLIASVRRSYLQFLFEAIDLPFLPDYWDYQYKLSHRVDEYNEIIVTGIGSIDDFSINVPEDYDPEQQATLDQVPIIKQQTNTMGISWKRRNRYGKGFTQLSLSTNRLENDFKRYTDNENQSGLYLQNNSTEAETKLRFNRTRFKGNWTLVSTASFQQVLYNNNSIDLLNNNTFENQINFSKYGASFQASSASSDDRLRYSLGLRFDGNTYTNSGNDIWKTLSPRISASYSFDPQQKWSVNASLGRYYKIPPYTILGYQASGQPVNQNAEYIRSDHAVLGLEYLLNPSSRVTLEGFFKKYGNYPVSLNQGVSLANLGGDFSVLGNEAISSTGEGRTYGVEFLYQKKFTNNYYAILACTWYRSEFSGLDGIYRPSAWDSNHLLTFTGGYKFGNNWEVSARTRYLGKTPYAPVDEDATLDNYPAIIRNYDQLGSVRLNAFNQTDIRVDKKWNFSKWTLNVFLELQNAFGQNIPNEPDYGLARDNEGNITSPRQLVQIEDIDNSSVLPSLGIVIDF